RSVFRADRRARPQAQLASILVLVRRRNEDARIRSVPAERRMALPADPCAPGAQPCARAADRIGTRMARQGSRAAHVRFYLPARSTRWIAGCGLLARHPRARRNARGAAEYPDVARGPRY